MEEEDNLDGVRVKQSNNFKLIILIQIERNNSTFYKCKTLNSVLYHSYLAKIKDVTFIEDDDFCHLYTQTITDIDI